MFATIKCHSRFWLLLLLAPLLLDHAYAQQHIGDRCSTPQGPGVCQLIDQCPSVLIGLKSDDRPVTCGFQDNTLIVCCSQPKYPPSKQACKEYERSIFAPQYFYPVINKRRFFNVSEDKAFEFPHTAAVGFNTKSSIIWGCGGTLISDRFVLTAAHCLSHPEWGDAQWVRLGHLGPNKATVKVGPQVLRIIEKIRHPDYNTSMKYNDIALLKLERSVTFTPFIKPACLDTKENHTAGEEAVVTGWGLTDFNDDDSKPANFVKIKIPIVAHYHCANFYANIRGLPHGIDDRTQICAGENDKDDCQSDGGGALLIKTKALSLYRAVGISSFGQACAGLGPGDLPGVYTRVSSYRSWIEGIVWPKYSAWNIDQRIIN